MAGLVTGANLSDITGIFNLKTSKNESSESSETVTYPKVANPAAIAESVLGEEKAKTVITVANIIANLFGKNPLEMGKSYVDNILEGVKVPLEVDCDPKLSFDERIDLGFGNVTSASGMTNCTITDVVKSLESSIEQFKTVITIGGIEIPVLGKDLKTAMNISNLYERIPFLSTNGSTVTRNVSVRDRDTDFAVTKRVMDEAMRIGAPELVMDIISKAPTPEFRDRLLLSQLRTACIRSYLDILEYGIETLGIERVRDRVPDAAFLIIRYYKYRGGDDHYAELNRVKSILLQLNPGLFNFTSSGTYYENYEPFMNASNDARDLFMLDDELYVHSLIGSRNGNEPVIILDRQMYPYGRQRVRS